MPSDKPAPVSLNLDTLEREGAPGPFAVVFAGKHVTFTDAMEVDYHDLLTLAQGDPDKFFDVVLAPEDAEHFRTNKFPMWKLRTLVESYQTHYGIDPGNLGASQPS